MGTIRVRRQDGSRFEVRTTKRTKHVRLLHEKPAHVDLADLGEVPLLGELSLSGDTVLEALDLAPLAGATALTSLRATVAHPPDLAPLAELPLTSLAIDLDGSDTLDLRPLYGHPTLSTLSLGFLGTQASLSLGFARELPKLTSLSIDGGNWKELDLTPLKGLPLRSFTLVRQYVSAVDLTLIAQPSLEHLMLQELDVREGYWSLAPLRVCKDLVFLSLLGAEVGTLEVGALAKLEKLRRFDPPNVKSMMMSPEEGPIVAPGLLRWQGQIGVE